MTHPLGPKPLLDDVGSSPMLRQALQAARDDVPDADHFETMLGQLPIAAPLATTAVGSSILGSLAAKVIIAVAVAVVGGGSVAMWATRHREPATTPAAVTVSSTAQPPVASVTASAAAEPSDPEPVASAATSAPVRVVGLQPSSSAAPSASVVPPASDMELLRQAHAALGSDPSRAMQLVGEHARYYPSSPMGLEREMIRIQALLALGRRAEAQQAAAAFRARNPKSAYLPRLDQILPDDSIRNPAPPAQ